VRRRIAIVRALLNDPGVRSLRLASLASCLLLSAPGCGLTRAQEAGPEDAGIGELPDGGGCECTADDGGPAVATLACACKYGTCDGISTLLKSVCTSPGVVVVQQTTYPACKLIEVDFTWGASGSSNFYDSTTGALVGFFTEDDSPDLACPGARQGEFFVAVGAGITSPPADCGSGSTVTLCQIAESEGDASAD
jgi:hypothetical protein